MTEKGRYPTRTRRRTTWSRFASASVEVARALAVLAVLVLGALLIAGHVTPRSAYSSTSPAGYQTSPSVLLGFRDTLAVLRRDGFEGMGEEDVNALLVGLQPLNLLAGPFREAAESLTAQVRRLSATPSVMPTQGWLSSNFSRRRYHPLLHVNRPHEGIDVRAPLGTPIEAPAAGTVIKTGWEGGYGQTVNIDHGYGTITRYAHASRILVEVGQRVRRGQMIALVGSTGLAEAPHLHYEVLVDNRPVDPLRYVLPAVIAD